MSGGQTQLQWMVDRLRVMPPAELPHRVREQLRRWRDRQRPPSASPAVEAAPRLPLHRPVLTPAARARLQDDVARLLADDFLLLGLRWPSRRAWGLDPGTGRRWPLDGPADRLDLSAGDIRAGWELLRLQHLQVLALGAALLDHDAARQALDADLRDLLGALRPFEGIAYGSGIECGLRVISLLVIGALVPLPAGFGALLADHAAWLRRYPSLYSSANNHRIAELAGLYLLGLCAPEIDVGGLDALEAELVETARLQFYPDGVGTEQSIGYQGMTTELLALCAWAARAHQRDLSALSPVLLGSAGFLSAVADRDGNTPNIGDLDESMVLRDGLRFGRYPAAVAGLVSALLSEPSVRPASWEPDLRCGLLGLSDPGAPPPVQGSCFAAGGYTVFRPAWGMVVFDHGPLGFASTGGHGHADALSVWVHRDGVPIVVDAGTHRYHDAAPWRTWSRGTASHNTVSINGHDQSRMTGAFNWGRRARASLERVSLGEGTATASHDGYLPILHRRTVTVRDDGFDLIDRVEGEGSAAVAARLLLCAELSAAIVGDEIHIFRGGALEATVREVGGGLVPSVAMGEPEAGPGLGWCARGYNRAAPAPCLEWAADATLPAEWTIQWRWAPGHVQGKP